MTVYVYPKLFNFGISYIKVCVITSQLYLFRKSILSICREIPVRNPKLKSVVFISTYLILIRIHLSFAPLIFTPLIFAHHQISRPFNFRAPLFYCEFAVFLFICGIISSPLNFRAFGLRELAPFNFRAG